MLIDNRKRKQYNISAVKNTEVFNTDSFAPDVLTVADENGQDVRFEILDSIDDANGTRILAVVPVFENSDDILNDMGEFDIVKLREEDEGFVLAPIDDEKELKKLQKLFEKRIEEKLYQD